MINDPSPCRSRNTSSGFTLLELLAAIAVLGIASTVFISSFLSSVDLANSSRDHRVASQLAEEYLADLTNRPELFQWPHYQGKVGEPLPVVMIEGDGPILGAENPAAMPTVRRAYEETDNLYDGYTWGVVSILPTPDSNVVELLVEVSWTRDGRKRSFTMSSLQAREGREGIH